MKKKIICFDYVKKNICFSVISSEDNSLCLMTTCSVLCFNKMSFRPIPFIFDIRMSKLFATLRMGVTSYCVQTCAPVFQLHLYVGTCVVSLELTTVRITFQSCLDLTGGNWQKWKRVFLTCPFQKIFRDEAVSLKSCKYTWKIKKFVKMGNLGQYRENLIFCQ